jgi:glycogen debranching enzyme
MRTLASSHPAYNPYGYHRGAVWPVEHGPFALGLRRYGLRTQMLAVCQAQFDLLRLFEAYRLPECVAGHGRDEQHPFPPVFPAANSPQAWSATAPLQMMHALLGVEPDANAQRLYLDPWLPSWLPHLDLLGLRVGKATVDVRFRRQESGDTAFEVLSCRGDLEVSQRRSRWNLDAGLE